MKLTLYKNCKLNNAYKNVFAFGLYNNSSLIDKYLETLTKVQLNIDNVYQERSGVLIFEVNGVIGSYDNIHEYNYMKILSDDTTIKRYCFIDYFDLINDVVRLAYSEDIWHNYGSSMEITESYLSRNRLADKSGFHNLQIRNLPIEYESSYAPSVSAVALDYANLYDVYVEVQLYDTVAVFSRTTKMQTYLIKLEKFNYIGGTDYEIISHFSFDEAEFYIKSFIMNQPIKCAWIGANENLYYSIEKTYIIPTNMKVFDLFNVFNDTLTDYDKAIYFSGDSQQEYVNKMNFIGFLPKQQYLGTETGLQIRTGTGLYNTLKSNYTRLGFGTLAHQIPIANNGIDILFSVDVFVSIYTFNITLSISNTVVDITDDFVYQCPVEQISGAEWQQKKFAMATKVISSAISIGTGIGGMLTKDNVSTSTQNETLTTDKTTTRTSSRGKQTKWDTHQVDVRQTMRKVTHPKNNYSSIDRIGENIVDTVSNYFPQYNTTSGVSITKDNNLNCYYGLLDILMNTQNEDFVEKSIDNSGWIVYEWIKNLNITGLKTTIDTTLHDTYKYNFIKFECINVYGKFPRDIANELEEILYNGTKVWFNESEIS